MILLKVNFNEVDLLNTTVVKWSKKEDGSVEDQERSGRPSKMTPRTKRRVTDLMRDKVAGVRPTTTILNNSPLFVERNKTVDLGVTTVRRCVRSTDWRKTACKERITPMLLEKTPFPTD